jgi:hypothetical protein
MELRAAKRRFTFLISGNSPPRLVSAVGSRRDRFNASCAALAALDILKFPLAFTQSPPVTTADFVSKAKERGLPLDTALLRELYRHGDLVPLLEISARRVAAGAEAPADERFGSNSLTRRLFSALVEGRLRDPADAPFRPKVRFDSRRTTDPRGWSNGLFSSRWQLLSVPSVRGMVHKASVVGGPNRRRTVLPVSEFVQLTSPQEYRRWAIVLSVLETRYLPEIGIDFLELTNLDEDVWNKFQAGFDPVATAERLSIAPDEVRKFAERLLDRAHTIDPNGGWSKLINRAPSRAWKTLTGDALIALDHRLAAEILLRFYDDLSRLGGAEPLPELASFRFGWHPLVERLSATRTIPLDEILGDLGVSPHARVVLAVEGETEEIIVPRVFDQLGLRRSPDLSRILCMRTDGRDLTMVVALTVAPILGELINDAYWMVRPPTAIFVAIDPGQGWDTPEKIAKKRSDWIAEIQRVIAAQGGEVEDAELEHLVHVRVWDGKCFELEHFSDQEIASALQEMHPNCGGLSVEQVTDLVAMTRDAGDDVEWVWLGWNPQPRKPQLADALWPALQAKIKLAELDLGAPVPSIAAVVVEAYNLAQSFNFGHYVIRAKVVP